MHWIACLLLVLLADPVLDEMAWRTGVHRGVLGAVAALGTAGGLALGARRAAPGSRRREEYRMPATFPMVFALAALWLVFEPPSRPPMPPAAVLGLEIFALLVSFAILSSLLGREPGRTAWPFDLGRVLFFTGMVALFGRQLAPIRTETLVEAVAAALLAASSVTLWLAARLSPGAPRRHPSRARLT